MIKRDIPNLNKLFWFIQEVKLMGDSNQMMFWGFKNFSVGLLFSPNAQN